NIDAASGTIGSVDVSGWVIDPDIAGPVDIHVYVNGRWGGAYRADAERPDVGAVYPDYGAGHGFRATVPVTTGGTLDVCVYGINVSSGTTNPLLGCRKTTAPGGNPFGNFEGLTSGAACRAAQG